MGLLKCVPIVFTNCLLGSPSRSEFTLQLLLQSLRCQHDGHAQHYDAQCWQPKWTELIYTTDLCYWHSSVPFTAHMPFLTLLLVIKVLFSYLDGLRCRTSQHFYTLLANVPLCLTKKYAITNACSVFTLVLNSNFHLLITIVSKQHTEPSAVVHLSPSENCADTELSVSVVSVSIVAKKQLEKIARPLR